MPVINRVERAAVDCDSNLRHSERRAGSEANGTESRNPAMRPFIISTGFLHCSLGPSARDEKNVITGVFLFSPRKIDI